MPHRPGQADPGERPTEHIASVPPGHGDDERTRQHPATGGGRDVAAALNGEPGPDNSAERTRITGPPAAGAAGAGATGAAAAGAAASAADSGNAAGSNRADPPTEVSREPAEAESTRVAAASPDPGEDPGLLTHRSEHGGYNYYAREHEPDPYEDEFEAGHRSSGARDGGPGRDEHDDFDLDDFSPPEDPDDEMSAARKKHGRRKVWRGVRRTCYVAAALMIVAPAAAFAWCYFTFDVASPQETAENYNTSLVVNYSNGELLNKFSPSEGESRVLIDSLDEVSPDMLHATMAAEDADFYSNPGFSVSGIARAVYNQLTGGQGGGSTITQQYVKLSTGKDDHSLTRKFTEIVRAFKLTNQYDKNTILKAYLNTAYYGRGAYGIVNAADAYFDKKPSELDPAESAVLAGMVQLPRDNDPRVNQERAQQRWDYVTGEMVDNGWLDRQQLERMSLPETEPRMDWTGSTTAVQLHIKQRILEELEAHGYTQGDMTSQGLQVVSTLDQQAQQAAVRAVEQVMQGQPDKLIPALSAVDPETGAVRAYYGGGAVGRDWADYPQPPGSSFKPFVTLAGLEQGYGIGEVYDGSSPQTIRGTEYANAAGVRCDDPERCGVREATKKSVNTVFVKMAEEFGAENVAEAAHEAGIPRERTVNGKKTKTLVSAKSGVPGLGIALGAYGVSTTNMANAYGSLADGERAEPNFVQKVVTSDGELVEEFGNDPEPAFSASESKSRDLAANVTETMRDVADYSGLSLDGDRPVASKSGTHQLRDTGHNERAWYVGYTPQISTAVSLNAETKTGPEALLDKNGSDIYGANLPGDIWQKFMNAYLEGKPVEKLPEPSEKIGQYTVPPPPAPEPSEEETPESSEPPTSSSEPPTSSQPPTSSSEPPSSTSEPTETTDCSPYWDPDCEPGEENDEEPRQPGERPHAQGVPAGREPESGY
ncbi:penicillin-binding protein [Actinopolyspora mortivallis]|uniref:Penicillin-binding protein n=1 Tax=Actinopolyspora mortivallis TaxID=33906 RepID=A0A2T0GU02_ACTMO|nr:penicillin-binding protein [Actinopolyspora mortivallis]